MILSFIQLVIKLLLFFDERILDWIQVVPIISVHIRSCSSSLKKLMVELFIWVVVMLAISLGWVQSG